MGRLAQLWLCVAEPQKHLRWLQHLSGQKNEEKTLSINQAEARLWAAHHQPFLCVELREQRQLKLIIRLFCLIFQICRSILCCWRAALFQHNPTSSLGDWYRAAQGTVNKPQVQSEWVGEIVVESNPLCTKLLFFKRDSFHTQLWAAQSRCQYIEEKYAHFLNKWDLTCTFHLEKRPEGAEYSRVCSILQHCWITSLFLSYLGGWTRAESVALRFQWLMLLGKKQNVSVFSPHLVQNRWSMSASTEISRGLSKWDCEGMWMLQRHRANIFQSCDCFSLLA